MQRQYRNKKKGKKSHTDLHSLKQITPYHNNEGEHEYRQHKGVVVVVIMW